MIRQEDIALLSNLEFWNQLSQSQQDLMISVARLNTFKAGTNLHSGENECIGVLYVKSGTIRTYIVSDEGREVTLYRLRSNDVCILSSSCVLQTIAFDVFVDAESDCEVIQISSLAYSRIASENVHLELFSYKLATERFSDVMWAMQQLLFTSFDKRLAGFLLDESMQQTGNTIHMTHEQIARHLGSAREVVSRMLKHFANEEILQVNRGDITLLDVEKLRAILRN